MAAVKRVLKCDKCDNRITMYVPVIQAWHESCPNREPRKAAPIMREEGTTK